MAMARILTQRATFLRESVEKSNGQIESMVTILGSFDHRLSALEAAMRPTQAETGSIRRAHENIDKTLKATEIILAQFDISRQAEATILRGPQEDLESYLEAMEMLRSNIRFFNKSKSFKNNDGVLNHMNNLLAKAMQKLEEEFRLLLANYSKAIESDHLYDCLPNTLRPIPEAPGHQAHCGNSRNGAEVQNSLEDAVYKIPVLIPPRVIPLLHDLAQNLVKAGYQQQCLKIYRDARAPVLELSLKKLGVERLSKDEVQKMQWDSLETKIQNWVHFMRIAVKILFSAEHKVSNQVFDGITFNKDQCFAEVTADSLDMLLSFGEAIASSKRSPEKLFVLLDMYEVLLELQPEIEKIFEGKACLVMRESALSLAKHLAQTVAETFGDFEAAVENDATKNMTLDGSIHPLTSYVINYVKFLFDYQSILKQLFQTVEVGKTKDSQLAIVTARIMQALQTNLDGKSKQYKDPGLGCIFLMNNTHYMVRSLCRSEAKDVLGDDWVQRHRKIVQNHASQYKRVAWTKILQLLSVQVSNSSGGNSSLGSDGGNSSGVHRTEIKERLKFFNMQFEEFHMKQSQWTVPDPELREYLRLAISEVLLPAYRSFMKRFGSFIGSGKNHQKYIRYSAEDLDRMLGEFFEGKQQMN